MLSTLALMAALQVAPQQGAALRLTNPVLSHSALRIPRKDAKVLVSWNGLAIAALAQAGRTLAEPRFLEAAERASGFILDRLRRPDGRLLHTYKDGVAKLDAYLDDYACLIDGLTRLYEATGAPRLKPM